MTKHYTETAVALPNHEILYVGFDQGLALRIKAWGLSNGRKSVTIHRERVTGSLKRDKLFHYTVVGY